MVHAGDNILHTLKTRASVGRRLFGPMCMQAQDMGGGARTEMHTELCLSHIR